MPSLRQSVHQVGRGVIILFFSDEEALSQWQETDYDTKEGTKRNIAYIFSVFYPAASYILAF